MLQYCKKSLVASIAAMVLAQPALAVLQRQGPIDASHGFPAWFQDRNGVALEICSINDPVNGLAVVNAGLCAIVNAAAPAGVQVAPEVFPANFTSEHFYTLTSAILTPAGQGAVGVPTPGSGRVVFNFALEAAFATGTPAAGQQLWFTRWRVNHTSVACTGSHTYYTPTAAPQTFAGVARGKTFQTSDAGMGNAAAVMNGNIGPFLLAADVAGGAAKAPFIGPDGKKYLSDVATVTPITGSLVPNALANSSNPFVPNDIKAMPFTDYVAVEGPGVATGNCAVTEVVAATNTFNLFGRFFEGAIASRTSLDRATYRAVDTNGDGTSDTFQIGTWATATQEANRPVPRLGLSLWFTDPANPANTTAEIGMESAQLPATTAAPAGVLPTPVYALFQGMTVPTQPGGTSALPGPVYTNARVRVMTDTPVSSQDVALVDELRINQAVWNSVSRTLTVSAESGAYLQTATPTGGTAANAICSIPCLILNAYGLPLTDAANAAIDFKMKTPATAKAALASVVIPNVLTPPAFVTVTSSTGGRDTQPVLYQGTATGTALFQPDVVNVPRDTPVHVDVFANDLGVAAIPALTICNAASAGTCAVPNPATACVAGVASAQCTALGGRISLNGNLVSYTPPLNMGGVTDTFWYQAATVNNTTARTQVSAVISSLAGLPDARDDLGNAAVAAMPVTIDVLANDFAPSGINIASLSITQEPCNFATGVCAPGTASLSIVPGKLVFTAPTPGEWNLAYTFIDKNGVRADPGVVAVNALAAETLGFQRALWKAAATGASGLLTANGSSNISLGQRVQLMVNAAGQTNACANPAAGSTLATAVVAAGGVWSFASITLPSRPTTVYLYSPSFGACVQATVQ